MTAGASGTVPITFAPDTSGPVTGSVTVVSTAANSPVTVSLNGSGIVPGSHFVELSWIGSTSVGVVGYLVYRGLTPGGPYSTVNSNPVPTTTYTDAAVKSGTVYYYVVTAVDGGGNESVYSNESVATIPIP